LLRELDVEPEPGSRERALEAGIELVARDGLTALSMDEVAQRAGVSRANLYRLFPGKPALFRELIRFYSPLEPITSTIRDLGDQPPEVLMPAIARTIARHLEGRAGLVRAVFFEVAGAAGDAAEAREFALRGAVGALAAYVTGQMEAGRLRPMHPLLAIQAFAGPIVFHLVTRPYAETLLGLDVPLEDAVEELARTWLAAMRPEARREG
jgi:AcrR family transcriptional regulator